MNDPYRRPATAGAIAALTLAGTPLPALENAAAALEEVVVTARKREEPLQATPISVTAFSGDDLRALQVDDLSQISRATPGLVFDATTPISGSSSSSSIFIRGVGQTDFTLVTDPGVGLYLDGVYIARSVGGVLDVIDFERVEVLRGPQGTLFGKNTIGGAINVQSRRPRGELGGYVEVRTGTDERFDVKASVDLPVTERVAAKVSLAHLRQDGYVDDLNGGPDLSDRDAQIAHFMVVADLTERLTATLSGDYTQRREEARAQRLLAFDPASAVPTFALAPPGFAAGGFACGPIGLSAEDCATPFVTFQGTNTPSDLDLYGLSLTLDYDLGDVAFKSITGYRKFDSKFARDTDNSPFVVVETFDLMKHDQISQEFQITGTALDARLDWVGGVYYFQEDGTNFNRVDLSLFTINSGGAIDNDQIAVFGQATYDLTERWALTAGARYTEETKRFRPGPQTIAYNDVTRAFLTNAQGQLVLGPPGTPPVPDAFGNPLVDGGPLLPNRGEEFSADVQDLSLMASLDYRITDDFMVYISYSEGFKSGGFSQRVFPPRSAPVPFDPEEVAVVEGGWKWTGLDDRLRVNGSLYHTEYDDIQVTAIVGIGPSTQNAAEGEITGMEIELAALPLPDLELNASLAWTDAEFTEVRPEALAAGFVNEDSEFVNTPEWSAFIGGVYRWPFAFGELVLRSDASYRDEVFNNAQNSPALLQDALVLVNASLELLTADEHWSLVLAGRNLTDERYIVTGNDEIGTIGYTEAIYAREREWSLALRYRF